MIYQIKISKQANLDLRDIYEYITFTLLSPENAKKLLNTLEDKIQSLENFPKRFNLYQHELWNDQELRVMPVNNFLVFYISDNQNQIVTILRIMYHVCKNGILKRSMKCIGVGLFVCAGCNTEKSVFGINCPKTTVLPNS